MSPVHVVWKINSTEPRGLWNIHGVKMYPRKWKIYPKRSTSKLKQNRFEIEQLRKRNSHTKVDFDAIFCCNTSICATPRDTKRKRNMFQWAIKGGRSCKLTKWRSEIELKECEKKWGEKLPMAEKTTRRFFLVLGHGSAEACCFCPILD